MNFDVFQTAAAFILRSLSHLLARTRAAAALCFRLFKKWSGMDFARLMGGAKPTLCSQLTFGGPHKHMRMHRRVTEQTGFTVYNTAKRLSCSSSRQLGPPASRHRVTSRCLLSASTARTRSQADCSRAGLVVGMPSVISSRQR
jgi:hypothetical protein